ncbi:LysR family transcriptional regulator [Dermacoccaceae bacterium W4C1]
MESNHLATFVAVAQELSFTKAASQLHLGQSSVSAAVKTLEREVGTALFVRSTRSVELTHAGRELLPLARRVIGDVEDIKSLGRQEGAPLRGRLRVGLLTNLEWLELPEVLGGFHRKHPHVELSMQTLPRGSTDVCAAVRAGRLDLGFSGGLPPESMRGLRRRALIREPFVAVLPRDHPKSGASNLSISQLLDEPFVELPLGFGTRVLLDRWLRSRGLRRRVAVEVPDLSEIPAFVAAGLGIAIAPWRAWAGEEHADVVTIPVSPRLEWHLSVVTAPGPANPARDELADALVRQSSRQRHLDKQG